jgi:hypothetical protein
MSDIKTLPARAPHLVALADHCLNGACNSYALIRALGHGVEELTANEVKGHPAIKVILGQLSFLVGESLGPTSEALQAYNVWRKSESAAAPARQYKAKIFRNGKPQSATVFSDWFPDDEAAKTGYAAILAEQGYKVVSVAVAAICVVEIE